MGGGGEEKGERCCKFCSLHSFTKDHPPVASCTTQQQFTSSCGSFFLKNEDRTGTLAHHVGQPHTALCCETSRNDSLDRTKGTFSSAAIFSKVTAAAQKMQSHAY